MRTTVVHCKNPHDVYIGRQYGGFKASKWANPYRIGKDGTREQVIARYIEETKKNPELMMALPELRGKVLGCWCKGTDGDKDVQCHGDWLAQVADASAPELLACFTTHYSYGASILTVEEAGKTRPGNPVSIVDLAREHHLKQVTIVDERIDGVLEAWKNLSKPFKPTPVPSVEDLRKELDKDGKPKLSKPEAQRIVDEAQAKYDREVKWSTDPIQLIYGLKMTVVPDINDKTPDSKRQESSVIVFMRDALSDPKVTSPAYHDLVRLNNKAWTDGFYDKGRLDWVTLKTMWTPNLVLALPYFSSFLARNLLTMAEIVPDLPAKPTLFREVDSHLPFAHLIDATIDQYATATGAQVQPVKTIYYRDSAAFKDYTIFRARNTKSKGKIGTFSAPGVDNLCSDRFSFESYQELTK